MTRKEEIIIQAEEYRQPYRDVGYRLTSRDIKEAFEEGTEWADKTMVEKAVEWLKENIENYVVTCYDKGEIDDEGLLQDFRKAMLEEEQYED